MGKTRPRSVTKSIFTVLATEGYRWILLLLVLVQSTLSYRIPYVGPLLSFIQYAWIASYSSFEFSWQHMGYSLEKRIEMLERHWVYHLAFGSPVTLMSFFFPQAVNQGVFALFFPFVRDFVMLLIDSTSSWRHEPLILYPGFSVKGVCHFLHRLYGSPRGS